MNCNYVYVQLFTLKGPQQLLEVFMALQQRLLRCTEVADTLDGKPMRAADHQSVFGMALRKFLVDFGSSSFEVGCQPSGAWPAADMMPIMQASTRVGSMRDLVERSSSMHAASEYRQSLFLHTAWLAYFPQISRVSVSPIRSPSCDLQARCRLSDGIQAEVKAIKDVWINTPGAMDKCPTAYFPMPANLPYGLWVSSI